MHRRAFAALAVSLAAAPALLSAEFHKDKIQRIEQVVSTEMARSTIPGVNIAVGSGSEVVWTQGFGLADLENMVPMTSRTAIRLASISKPITATAIMQLVEQGKIKLDAPIQEYVPQFPQKQWPVTVRQLLGHLGGVRHYVGDEISSTRHYRDRISPVEIFAQDELVHEPGTKYSYTSYGFNLLGAAVELVSGTPFMDYLTVNIFKPAGMNSIRDDDVYSIIPHRSRGYAIREGRLANCGLADTSNKIPGGGLIAPASDLVRFAIAFNEGKLVKAGAAEQMLTRQTTRDGEQTNYGLGFVAGDYKGHRFGAHGGGQQGTSTYLMFFPMERLYVAVMANREGAPVGSMAEAVADILFTN